MKLLVTILFVWMATVTFAQNKLSDTVKIKTVDIVGQQSQSNQEKLDSAVLYDPQHLNLGDLMSKKSHLFIKSYGIGSLATISLRGSGSAHTQLNWNGISMNSSMNGTSDLALFPLFFMDEVELNYGLNSSVDGTGGIGGSVNISTVPQFKKQMNLLVASTLGSFGQQQYNAKVKVGDAKFQSVTKFIYNIAENNFEYKDLTQQGFPQQTVRNASLLQKGIMQNFYFKLKNQQLLEANVWYFDSERNLPPLITLRENKETQNDLSVKSLVKYSKYFKNSELKVVAAYFTDELKYQNERANILTNAKSNNLKTRADYEFQLQKVKFHSQLIFNHSSVIADGLNQNVTQKRVEGFISAERKFSEQLKINLAARYLNVLNQNDYFLPKLRIDYEIKSKQLSFFSQVGKNVTYPNLNDLYYQPSGNLNLKAEQSETVEFGGNFKRLFFDNGLLFSSSASFFYSNIKNYILWEPTAFGFWQPKNLKSVETMGSELFLSIEQKNTNITKALIATYSYTSSKNYEKQHEFDESKGKQLIYIPEHKGNVELKLGIASMGTSLSINSQMIGVRYISSDNEEFLPAYQLLDVTLSQPFSINRKSRLSVNAGIKNVLNSNYQAIEWRPMPGRNYFVKLAIQFNK